MLSAEDVRGNLSKDPLSGYSGIDIGDIPEPPIDPGLETGLEGMEPAGTPPAQDKSVSEAQHKAMAAAAEGNSTLGIPEKVGEEFLRADKTA